MDDKISEEFIRQYLISRNLTGTLDAFDAERSRERTRHRFQPSTILNTIRTSIVESKWDQLVQTWNKLQSTFFSRLDTDRQANASSFKAHAFKTYVIYALSNGRKEKVTKFFENLSTEFSSASTEWRGWYALPYINNPQELPEFAMYFSQSWLDIFSLSLSNFICVIFSMDFQNSIILKRLDLLDEHLKSLSAAADRPTSSQPGVISPPPFGKPIDDFNELGSFRSNLK